MKIKHADLRFGVVAALIFIAALSRLIPHPPNFTPLGAMALFGVAYLNKKRYALLIPLLALWISDLLLNNLLYSAYFKGFTWFYPGAVFTYGAFMLIALLGYFMLNKVSVRSVFTAGLTASIVFFLVSNFGVWMAGTLYPKNYGGLLSCYIAGIPFLKYTLLGNLVYCLILFGGFEWAKIRFPELQTNAANR